VFGTMLLKVRLPCSRRC